jgi:hypothetical protein
MRKLMILAVTMATLASGRADVTVNLSRSKLRAVIIAMLTHEGWTLTKSSAHSMEFYRASNCESCGNLASFKMTPRDGKTFVHGSGFRWGMDENDKPFKMKIEAKLLDEMVRLAAKEAL